MFHRVTCSCGHSMFIPEKFRDSTFHCPACGHVMSATRQRMPASVESDACKSTTAAGATTDCVQDDRSVASRMFEALLDVRTIRKLLAIGGGLFVIGTIVWLVSIGVFENKMVLASALGGASLLLLGSGWLTTLRTKYKIAGQALTFLACVVLPLNLWFYHAQDLVRVDQHLWIGGLVCALLYAATVFRLRDPLFMYAFEAGVTLTVLLVLGNLGIFTDAMWLSVTLVALAAISIHSRIAFPPEASGVAFDRKRYGMPLFWSGHVQLLFGIALLAATQVFAHLPDFITRSVTSNGWTVRDNDTVATAIWLAASYLFFFSGLRVHRHRTFFYLAASTLIAAELTLVSSILPKEWLVALLGVTGLVANVIENRLTRNSAHSPNHMPSRLGVALGILPVAIGGFFVGRIVFDGADQTPFQAWSLTFSLGLTAICSAITAWMLRSRDDAATTHAWIHTVAAGLAMIAATEAMGIVSTAQRASVVMLLPIAYAIGARLVREASVRKVLYLAAHCVAGITIITAVFGPFWPLVAFDGKLVDLTTVMRAANPWPMATLFAIAAVYYGIAATVKGQSWNRLAATVMIITAAWQALGYYHLAAEYEMLIFAGMGLSVIVAQRITAMLTGVDERRTASSAGDFHFGLFEAGNGVLSVALLAIFLQALGKLAGAANDWPNLAALAAAIGMSLVAAVSVGKSKWRRWYGICAISLTSIAGVSLALRSNLTVWRKIEIASVAGGLTALVAGYQGRFRTIEKTSDDTSTTLLWLGSLLVTAPLLCAAISQRVLGTPPAWFDELLIVVLPLLMLATGVAWQAKGTTLCGAATLTTYLAMVIFDLARDANIAAGIYLTVGGGTLFLVGILLSVYRERLMQIPQKVADREGMFRVLDWH